MSGIISAEPFNAYFPEILKDPTWQGFVTAIYEIGCLAGAITMLLYGDTLGRRRAIMTGAVIMIIGTIIQVTPVKGYHAGAQFILGRTITVWLQFWAPMLITDFAYIGSRQRNEHCNYSYIPGRVFEHLQPRSVDLYRGWYHRFRYTNRILD